MMVCIEWPDGYTILEPSNKSFLALIKLYDPFQYGGENWRGSWPPL